MKIVKRRPVIDLAKFGDHEFTLAILPRVFPRQPRERVIEEGNRLVFTGKVVPGSEPGRYRVKR